MPTTERKKIQGKIILRVLDKNNKTIVLFKKNLIDEGLFREIDHLKVLNWYGAYEKIARDL